MEVRQLSVFLTNQPGSLMKITQALTDADINLRALSIIDSTDFGLLRLVVDDVDKAITALEASNYPVNVNKVVVVDVEDRPGGLNAILKPLSDGGVNIDYIYAFAGGPQHEKALVLMKFNDNQKAEEILVANGLKVMSEEDIANI